MRFFEILENTRILATNITNFDFCFNKVCSNSDCAELGDIFICRRGSSSDGHDYIENAHKRGAKTFVCEYITDYLHKNPDIRYIVVKDASLAEVRMLDTLYGHPTKDMKLIGITGTNGKTSCAYMIKSLFDSAGYKTGLISTIKTLACDKDITKTTSESEYNSMTTPSPAQLYEYLYKMKEYGVEIVVMEASSHALVQRRLDALHFSLGIFTNLSEDHLDYHKDLTQYMQAKAHLFELCNIALINTDCKYGKAIFKALPCKAFSYGSEADFSFKEPKYAAKDTSFVLVHEEEKVLLKCPVPGDFTVYNALAAAAAAKIFKIDNKIIKSAMNNLAQIPGRLERVDIPCNFDVYIDYAHTPDALEKVLLTLKRVCRGRLITVFGCGGNREREKRPIMGRIATAVSDITVITSDNSRNEPREKIISEILSGVKRNSNYKVIENRKDAIRYALAIAKDGDTLLLAGKGHEDYEITENTRRHFCEKEIIKEYFESKC